MPDEASRLIPADRLRRPRRWGPTVSERSMVFQHNTAEGKLAQREARKVLAMYERPRIRRDCQSEIPGQRHAGRLRIWGPGEACPWAACKYHLAVAINPVTGGMKVLTGWDDGDHVCVLDLADEGRVTLDRAGHLEGITRERVRQIEVRALIKLRNGREELMDREVPADSELWSGVEP